MEPKVKLSRRHRAVLDTAAQQRNDESHRKKARAYYHGNQATQAVRGYRQQHEITGYTTNLIKDTINASLGIEEKSRVEWMIKANDDASTEMAEGLNFKLNEAMRLIDANHHCSEAFKQQCIGGLGVLYLAQSTDPLGLPYDLEIVPTEDYIYDQTSVRADQKDCDWQCRRRYLLRDQVKALHPKHEKLIDSIYKCISSDTWDLLPSQSLTASNDSYEDCDLGHYMEHLLLTEDDTRLAVYDLYYRSYEKRPIIKWPDGRAEQYDPKKFHHVEAHATRQATVREMYIKVMRNAWYIGAHCISDTDSPHPHNEFPFVQFRGYMNDDERRLYGLVEELISPQDAYNEANVRMQHLMNSIVLIADEDAFPGKTTSEVIKEINRSDTYLQKRRGADVHFDRNWNEIQKLTEIKQDALQEIRILGSANATLGHQEGAKQSGVALQEQTEQDAITQADFTANYQFGRTMLGRLMLAHLLHEIGDNQEVVNITSDTGRKRKEVVLNGIDDRGEPTNQLQMARVNVLLAPVNTSEGYRAQILARMMMMYESSDDETKAEMFPMIIEASDFPRKEELLDRIHKLRGTGATEEEQAQIDQQQAEQQQQMLELEMRERMAKVMVDEANAAKIRAEAENIQRGAANDAQTALDQEIDAATQEADQKVIQLDAARAAIAKRASSAL